MASRSCSTTKTLLPRSTQAAQRLEQARVVARVEADRGLVEDVEHADERGADLRGQADALALAARERLRDAIEREVVEPDVDEEAEPRDDRARGAARRWRARAPLERAARGAERDPRGRCARRAAACAPSSAMFLLAELHRERLGAQAAAVAGVARARDDEAAEIVVADRALVVVGIVGVRSSAPAQLAVRGSRRRSSRGTMPSYAAAALSCRATCPRLAEENRLPCAPRGASPRRVGIRRRATCDGARRPRSASAGGAAPAPGERPRPRAACGSRRGRRARDRSSVRAPMPSHAGHAPCGPLNENMRGSIGGSEMPHSMQAKRSLIQIGSLALAGIDQEPALADLERELDRVGDAAPSARPSATMRSTTTSRSCALRAIEHDLVAEVDDLRRRRARARSPRGAGARARA